MGGRLTSQIVALVTDETKAEIERIAKEGGVSAGAVIRYALRFGLGTAASLAKVHDLKDDNPSE